jgi:hypothetical protein
LAFELQAEGAKELYCRLEVLDDNADVVHPLNRHAREVYGHSGTQSASDDAAHAVKSGSTSRAEVRSNEGVTRLSVARVGW